MSDDLEIEIELPLYWFVGFSDWEDNIYVIGIFDSEEAAIEKGCDPQGFDFGFYWIWPLHMNIGVGTPEDLLADMPDRIMYIGGQNEQPTQTKPTKVDRKHLTVVQ